MEPLTTLLVIGGMHVARKLRSRSNATPATATAIKCRWCGKPMSGHTKTTTCCQEQICASCVPQWAQAGGMNCVFCNTIPPR